jgi:tetratricopeptide (TPR) repeat protein
MSESAFGRFWNTLKPPVAAGPRPDARVLALRRRQRWLIMITAGTIFAIAVGAGIVNYIENAPQRADKEFEEGMKLLRPGKYPDAVTHFTRALSTSPQLADAYLERGSAHRSLGEDDAALADFQAAANLNPALAEAHIGMALIYIARHDSRHAFDELNKSIDLKPTLEAYYQRGEILDNQGEHQKAIDDFNAAIAFSRDSPDVYLARAQAKANLGDLEGAHADRVMAGQLQK